jgi:hypothetical protein
MEQLKIGSHVHAKTKKRSARLTISSDLIDHLQAVQGVGANKRG